ncbi:ABC transporter ATP-binding protein [Candidatus Poribacteria bacterium]|jgi:oligopeptide/dipeptide ABC transporter ATP-binding protein|nr:ABC transporter ATP-binding protein [Candidatus Poribacteria bacterium]MBT5536612.1 ABC transporter ATP-binding protein [Candidatus Poribacteria bacterium]MBT5710817.1 ABC transporter ATP-binding protein [Candidatus Poribacteria bacterium]MBT7804404.1 ABC transporter ATP-binding protein [Candidatus Poribacteria bacterium]
MPPTTDPLLRVRELRKHFPIHSGVMSQVVGHVRAVDGVSFDIYEGECLGLVGESGSGKTTVGRVILRALSATSGDVHFRVNGSETNLTTAPRATLKSLRRHMQMVFQDPYASLNPRMTVFDIVGEPLLVHGMKDAREREAAVEDLLRRVGLESHIMRRYPHAFSGGQRQRIGIARALALRPKLIVADEPVSALDVSVQAQVLNLLQDLREELRLTYLFIAHDLSVVRHISDRIAVMYAGRIVEMADADALFRSPKHPYTEALLSSVPAPHPNRRRARVPLEGEVADPSNLPPGCAFHPRCPYVRDECREEMPELLEIVPAHTSRCHLAGELGLVGLRG